MSSRAINVNAGGVLAVAAVVVVAGVGILAYRNRAAIAAALDPTKDTNLAYQGSNAIVRAVTGDQDATVGTKAFEVVDRIKKFLGFAGEPDLSKPVIVPRPSASALPRAGNSSAGDLAEVYL